SRANSVPGPPTLTRQAVSVDPAPDNSETSTLSGSSRKRRAPLIPEGLPRSEFQSCLSIGNQSALESQDGANPDSKFALCGCHRCAAPARACWQGPESAWYRHSDGG